MDLEVESGTVNDVPVTGTGISVNVFVRQEDGSLNVYMYDSLTLTPETGEDVTIVIETMGIIEEVE